MKCEKLDVWKKSARLATDVYKAFRESRDFGFKDQITRSALSIPSNIAEGFERGSRRQHIEFTYIAKGSAGELRSQVIVAHDVGLLDEQAYTWLLEHCDLCSRKLSAYLRKLKETQGAYRGLKYNQECEAGDS